MFLLIFRQLPLNWWIRVTEYTTVESMLSFHLYLYSLWWLSVLILSPSLSLSVSLSFSDDGRCGYNSESSEVLHRWFLLTGVQYDNTHMVTTAETLSRQIYCGVCFSWQLSKREGTSTKHKVTANRRIPRIVVSVSGREQAKRKGSCSHGKKEDQ